MNPLILPIVNGIAELIKNPQHRKDNLKTKSTALAAASLTTAGTIIYNDQSLESIITSLVMGVISLILFIWSKPKPG